MHQQFSREAGPTEEAVKFYWLHRSLGKRLWLLLGMFLLDKGLWKDPCWQLWRRVTAEWEESQAFVSQRPVVMWHTQWQSQ